MSNQTCCFAITTALLNDADGRSIDGRLRAKSAKPEHVSSSAAASSLAVSAATAGQIKFSASCRVDPGEVYVRIYSTEHGTQSHQN
jgi:hypothetical protein